MNIKEIALNEINLHPCFIEEGISALLHTILYLRAPNSVKFLDNECVALAPLSFAKCDAEDVELTVRDAIANLYRLKTSIGPQISRGFITLTFFENREQKGFFGWQSKIEKVCFERWKISIVIDESPLPTTAMPISATEGSGVADATAADAISMKSMEAQSLDLAKMQIQDRILTILETVNRSIDHVPPTPYEYEIEVGERRSEQSIVTRLMSSPA